MNILLISHYAGAPQYGMEYRSYYMAREWVRQGHQVTVVGASFSHLRRTQPAASEETLEGIHYLWLPTSTYEGNGLARVRTMFQFVTQVFRRAKAFAAQKPGIVIASSVYTFDIYPCRRIARIAHAKLVYEIHDLWPLSPMVIGGYSKWHPFIWLLQRGENYAYRHCDMIVSLLDKALPHAQRHGLTPNRFTCIPNGYLPEEWTDIPVSQSRDVARRVSTPETEQYNKTATAQLSILNYQLSIIQSLHQQGKIIIGFAGGHTQSTAMHILLHAAKQLQNRSDLAFLLVGDGPQKAELVELADTLQLTNTHFLPPIPKSAIPLLLTQFDICYAGGVHSILHQYGTSFNKITDYMLASKPIIFSVDEPHSLVQRVGCGLQVEAENIPQVAQAILQLAALSPQQRDEMGTKGHDYAVQHLQYPTLAKQFLQSVFN